jgi:hypothetical protein
MSEHPFAPLPQHDNIDQYLATDMGEIVNTCGWDRGDLPSILLSDHLPRVVF